MYYYGIGKQKDSRGFMICLIIFSFLLIFREVIKSGYLLYMIIVAILFVILWFVYKKVEKIRKNSPARLGAEFQNKYPIIVQYSPPKGINPAEAGLLYNLKVDITDLTSLIYRWKFKGLIDVSTFVGKNSNKEYVKLTKINDMPLTCPLFETDIFDSIFAMGDVKIIEESFQLRYALMLEDLEYHGIRKGWIIRSELSNKWRYLYDIIIVLLFFCMLSVLFDVFIIFSPILWVIFGILLLLSIFLGGYVYGGGKFKFTDNGAELASQVIGYRNFIKSCDENKIKLFLKQDPLFIDRTLPYATAFGMETEFLQKISPLKSDWNAKYVRGKKVPTWAGVLRVLLGSNESFWS